jgi:hypothetical protein
MNWTSAKKFERIRDVIELNSYNKEMGFATPKLDKEKGCIFATSFKKRTGNQQQNFNNW